MIPAPTVDSRTTAIMSPASFSITSSSVGVRESPKRTNHLYGCVNSPSRAGKGNRTPEPDPNQTAIDRGIAIGDHSNSQLSMRSTTELYPREPLRGASPLTLKGHNRRLDIHSTRIPSLRGILSNSFLPLPQPLRTAILSFGLASHFTHRAGVAMPFRG